MNSTATKLEQKSFNSITTTLTYYKSGYFIKEKEDYDLFEFLGKLNVHETPKYKNELITYEERGASPQVIVDLTDLKFVGSSGCQ